MLKRLVLFLLIFTVAVNLYGEDYFEITVKPGDTLSKISKKYLNSVDKWRELLKFNNISDPNKIFPGDKLKVPLTIAKKELLKEKKVVSENNSVAKVFFVKGNVWSEKILGKKLSSGDTLKEQSEIYTDKDSRISIEFYDKSSLTIGGNSKVKLEEFWGKEDENKPGKIRLFFGKVKAKIKHILNRSFSVFTPYAIGGVRGTVFRMSEKNGTTRLEVLKGRVALKAGGKEIIVPAGFGSVSEKGSVPSEPVKLPPPPKLLFPGDGSVLHVFKFVWQGNGEKYVFELSENSDFSKVIYSSEVTETVFYPKTIVTNKGKYYWRISTVVNGFTGLPSDTRTVELK